ncbi:MAG: glycosyltransferase [Hyphomicrobium sp.]|nr:glycosyltransferase [Hyphomicrobium sp.]
MAEAYRQSIIEHGLEMASPSNESRYLLMVVGMHRSGTSSVAGLYRCLGADLGISLMPPAPDNPKGFFENNRIVFAHDALLAALDRAWNSLIPPDPGWATSEDAVQACRQIKFILAKECRSNAPVWMVKDPRVCLLMPLWHQIAADFGRMLKTVVVVRHPEEIAASLRAREKMPFDDAMQLCLKHTQALAGNALPQGTQGIVYDALLAHRDDALDIVNRAAGGIFPEPTAEQRAQADEFLVGSLRRNSVSSATTNLGKLYEASFSSKTALISPEAVAAFIQRAGELPPEKPAPVTETDKARTSYYEGLKLAYARSNLQLFQAREHFVGFAKLQAEAETARKNYTEREEELLIARETYRAREVEFLTQTSDVKASWEQRYLQAEADRDFAIRDFEMRLALQRKDAETQMQFLRKDLDDARTANQLLTERIGNFEALLRRQSEVPFRTGLKSFIFGSARLGYRTLPLSGRQKQALLAKFGSRLSRIIPGAHSVAQPLAPNLRMATAAEVAEPDFAFKETDAPEVSIIVPVYNQINYTIRCLQSLAEHRTQHSFEVIVMDDVSNDQTQDVLPRIPGLRYVRNEKNLGFLKNCNKAAGLARGKYLVFLNNDTIVLSGWLDSLHRTFKLHGNVGLVGSKLIYPDGRLQEAGGIIWKDASGWNWGRLGNPQHPRFNYVRDADYVSGASIMIPRNLFEEIGRFDERYAPAYYEDTDLAFALRDKGYRVLYQPKSAVVHFEGISSGTDENRGVKRYQAVNRKKFAERWAKVLPIHGTSEDGPSRSADRRWSRHALIVDAVTPTPDQDSGSVDMVNLIRILTSLGWRVHFVPQTNYAHFGRYTDELQELGVECVYFPPYRTLEHYLEENGDFFDTVFVCREPIARTVMPVIAEKLPNAKRVFYTVDLHYLRSERQAELTKDSRIAGDAQKTKDSELALMRQSDLTILLSEVEKDIIAAELPEARTAIVPLIRDVPGRRSGFQTRSNVVFIGSFNHPPNVDAVEWLVKEIWPLVRNHKVNARLRICGSNMPDAVRRLCAQDPDIEAVGFVADLGEVFDHCRLSVAPLRFGAGLKGKLATSFGYGVPCIATRVAIEGMSADGLEPCRLQGETAEELADLIAHYYRSEQDWERASRASLAYVEQQFSFNVVRETVSKIMKDLHATKG